MLSDEQLFAAYGRVADGRVSVAGLRAVAEAAVKDSVSDWCVSDSIMAGRIMNVFGRSYDPSLEPAADPFRDKIAAMIYQHRTAVKNAVRYTSDGALAECPCCGSLDVGGAHDTVHCYKCGLSMKRPPPLQNAADAWNRRTRPQASAAVPDGFVLVPVDPTEKMHNAGVNACDNDWIDDTRTINSKVYRAMLAASQPDVNL